MVVAHSELDPSAWVAIAVMISISLGVCVCCCRKCCDAYCNEVPPQEGLSMPLRENAPQDVVNDSAASEPTPEVVELPAGRLGLVFCTVQRKGLHTRKMVFKAPDGEEDGWESKTFEAPEPGIYCYTELGSPLEEQIGLEPRRVLSVEGVSVKKLDSEKIARLLEAKRGEKRELVVVAAPKSTWQCPRYEESVVEVVPSSSSTAQRGAPTNSSAPQEEVPSSTPAPPEAA